MPGKLDQINQEVPEMLHQINQEIKVLEIKDNSNSFQEIEILKMSGKTVLMFNQIEKLLDKTVPLLNRIIEEMEMLEMYVLMLLY